MSQKAILLRSGKKVLEKGFWVVEKQKAFFGQTFLVEGEEIGNVHE